MPTELNNMYLASGGKLALAFGTSASKIYGSVDADTVTIAAGVTAVLDGSFNRGNDTIQFTGNAASYSIVKVNASTVKITDAAGTSVTIPVGSTGTHIQFADADRVLSGSSAGIVLGDQSVTSTAASLAAGTAPAEAYTLSVNAPTVTEGDAGSKTLSYKLTLDKAPTSTITVNYETLDTGSATANDDFVPGAGAVTFGAGQTVAYVSVTVLGDTTVEAPETVKLRLTGSKLVAAVDAVGTIYDNDQANLPVTYALTGSGAVNEGSAATFELKTTGLAAGTTVGYKVTGTGSAANKSATGTFTVDSDGNATVSVPVSENNTIGDTGSLTIELLNGKATPVVATVIDGTPTTYSAPAISTTNSGSGVQTINVAGTAAQSITLDTDQVTANNGFVINSATAAVSVTSGSSNDKITLTGNANNTIVTGAGNDTVNISGSGDNTVRVGSGNDTVVGGTGNDTIYVDAGNLSANDSIDGGAGNDTLVIAGDGNVINGTNVKNIENIVLAGTTVTVQDIAALANVKSISGHADSSDVTIANLVAGDVIDLTGISLTTLKNLTLSGSGTVTLKADAGDLINTIAIQRNGVTVNLSTDVAGYKALATADTGINGTKTVTATAQELIDNKAALTGASLVVSGTIGLTEAAALATAGVSATKTVSMSVADLLNAAKYPDQKAALTASGTMIQVLGTATVAEAASLISNYGNQISAYQFNAPSNVGIQIADTPANVGASSSASTLAATQVDTLSLTAGAGVSVADAARIVQYPFTGSYTVADSAANINTAITGATLPNSLSKAASVSLTTGNRQVTSSAAALELKQLGTKLSGGYDLALTLNAPLSSDDLSAIAGATKAALSKSSGTFSVSELSTILGQNAAATVDKVTDTATNLAGATSKLANVTSDIYVSSAATVAQATEINAALVTLFAKTGTHTIANSGGVYQNSYTISDAKASVLAAGSAGVVKGAEAVTVSDALTLDEALSLQGIANASNTDRLAAGNLTYTVSDSAANLATALSATSNTAAVSALAGASVGGVTATGTATVAQAKVLGTQYSSAVQVDNYKIADTVAKLFPSGTLSVDIDQTTDAALAKASALSVIGDVTVAQLTTLKGIQNAASATIFDNKYAIKDTAANVAAANTSNMVAATGITLSSAAAVADLANLKTLNDALANASKSLVSFALSDTISNIVGSSALGSGTAAVVTFAKSASSITVTGATTGTDAITLATLDNLATKAGSTAYSVQITDSASAISGLSAGITGNSNVTKLVLNDATLLVADAKSTIASVGSAASKLSYNLVDSYDNLVAAADSSVVLGAVNLTANDASLTAVKAATLLGLTGSSGTVTYNLVDTYANLVAQAAAVADGASQIDVSDSALSVAQYTELLARAGLTTTVSTTVANEAIKDTAANVSAASAAVLTHTSGVTLTDIASLTLSVAQAKALTNVGNNGYDVATTPANATLQVKIVDTAANLLAAAADSSNQTTVYVLGSGSYKVATSDTATLTAANATSLLAISDIAATFNLADASNALVSGGSAIAAVAKAGTITVTATAGDATTAAEAKAIYDANKNVSFNVVADTAGNLGASTGSGSSKVYTYAAALSKAAAVTVTSADSLANIAEVKAAAGSATVKYDLTDTAANFAKASSSDLIGATVITVTGGAKASEAAALAAYASKLAYAFTVSDTAANLVANVAAIKTIADVSPGSSGIVSVSSGTISASQYATLQNTLKNVFTNTTVTDSAAALADFISANNTAQQYAFTNKVVTAAQAKVLINASQTSSNTLIVQDSAANLLALGNGTLQNGGYKVTDASVDLATAKDLYNAFSASTGSVSFSVATTAERFNSAYTFDTDSNNGGVQPDSLALSALKAATTLTVDGLSVTLGVKDAALTAGARSTYNGNIVGTVAEINALPASLKSAAGYVIIDSVANITSTANTALVASSAGYVVKDSASNLLAASSSVLSSGQKALGIEVTGSASVADVNAILAKTDVDTVGGYYAVTYSLSDTAANLAIGTAATVDKATTISVTDVATAAQASTIVDNVTAAQVASLAVTDSATNIVTSLSTAQLGRVTSITVDTDTTTAGLQGFASVQDAGTIFTNATKATVSLNIKDSASNLSTAIGNANTALGKAAAIYVDGNSTAATAAEAKNLAKITVTGGYTVRDTATNLTTSTTVSTDDLKKATVVKILSGAATVQQAQTLVALGNLETGTNTDAGKYVMSIADSALNIAKYATSGLLDGITAASTVTVNDYSVALTAAQATTLTAIDTASTKLSVTAASVIVTDTSSALLDAANATAVAAVGTINVSDAVSVATLNQVKTAGGTGSGEAYGYKLQDTAVHLIVAGSDVVDRATSVRVTDAVSVADMTLIENRANGANVSTTTSYANVTDTAANLFSGSSLVATVANKADVIHLTGSATIAQVNTLLADSNFDKSYSVLDTAANIIAAIDRDSSLAVLNAAGTVGLASGEVASVAQAAMINLNLGNEAKLALQDTAANFNLAANAATVANAASVVVNSSANNDGLAAGVTAAKITYAFGDLANMEIDNTGSNLDVINGKAGDVIDLTGIANWLSVTGTAVTNLVLDTNNSLMAGEYTTVRGYWSAADGTFTASANGTDIELLIGTDNSAGAEEAIVVLGITSLTPNATGANDVNYFTFG